jgi:hypothetical protein
MHRLNSAALAWLTVLQQVEGVVRAHVTLADQLTESVSKNLKQNRLHVEDALKKARTHALGLLG